jgi:hypothetical protein
LAASIPVALAVADEGAFELGEGAHDLQLKSRQGVRSCSWLEGESFLQKADEHSGPGQVGDEPVEVDDAPGEPVHGGDDDGVLVSDVVEQGGQGGATGAGSGCVVGEPAVRVAGQRLADRGVLPVGVLVGGGDADVAEDLSGHL